MGLIPTDVGVNLRTQVDTALRPATPVAEIPSDLPELRQGQVFSASIQEVLPENTYKALVAGKNITLSLPAGAKAGDTLELVVVDKTPRMVMARLADNTALAGLGEQPYQHATFSPAAQLISDLLPAQGETPQPALLNRGAPLLPTPADAKEIANQLAPQLEKALTQSGMFYEAHQAKWIAGELPTEALLEEPQNQHLKESPTTAQLLAAKENTPTSMLAQLFGGERSQETTANQQTAAASHLASQAVPDELRHLVQQQLDAAATQRMAWHGEVWPQQTMDWEIRRDAPERQNGQTAADDAWNTRLALTMPRLGRVEAVLELRPQGLHLAVNATNATSAADLQQSLNALSNALEAAGIPPLSLRVWNLPATTAGNE